MPPADEALAEARGEDAPEPIEEDASEPIERGAGIMLGERPYAFPLGVTCNTEDCTPAPPLGYAAVIVTGTGAVTGVAVTVKVVLVCPAGTTRLSGPTAAPLE